MTESPTTWPDLAAALFEKLTGRALSWWSRRLGLPFGRLTIDKLAFARASLLGER